MNRAEAIKLIDTAQALGSANEWNMLDKLLWLVDAVEAKALAMPKADAESALWVRAEFLDMAQTAKAKAQDMAVQCTTAKITGTEVPLYTHPPKDAEPVAWLHHIVDPDGFVPDMRVSFSDRAISHEISREPLYTHPPQADAERDCKDCEGLLEDITELNKALNPEAYGIVDAERVALLERIDNTIQAIEFGGIPSRELMRDIRAYLGGDA